MSDPILPPTYWAAIPTVAIPAPRPPSNTRFQALLAFVEAMNLKGAEWGPALVPDSWLPPAPVESETSETATIPPVTS